MTKECKLCGKAFKPKNGRQKYCSYKCQRIADAPRNRERSKAYYYKHREECSERAKAYYRKHREECRKKASAYYHAHKDIISKKRQKKAYYQEPDFYKRMDDCCNRHGGIDNCPFDDCICN